MRVITGNAKGRRLQTLEGLDVRPTTERVKEAMFSMIQFALPGAVVLDLFAGSGQLGIEALSRGAKLCVFVDSSKQAHDTQKENLKATGLMGSARVVLNNHKAFLEGNKELFDVVFLDPPYDHSIIPEALDLLQDNLNENGLIICETGLAEQLPEKTEKLHLLKDRKYGKIKLWMYKLN